MIVTVEFRASRIHSFVIARCHLYAHAISYDGAWHPRLYWITWTFTLATFFISRSVFLDASCDMQQIVVLRFLYGDECKVLAICRLRRRHDEVLETARSCMDKLQINRLDETRIPWNRYGFWLPHISKPQVPRLDLPLNVSPLESAYWVRSPNHVVDVGFRQKATLSTCKL